MIIELVFLLITVELGIILGDKLLYLFLKSGEIAKHKHDPLPNPTVKQL
jgi:hypothetical protein